MLAGVLITMLVGILEVGMLYLVSALMEGSIRDATRYGTTGQGTDAQRSAAIVTMMNRDTLGFLHLTTANVKTKTYKSFSVIGAFEPFTDSNNNDKRDTGEPYTDVNGNGVYDLDQGKNGVGGAEDIVLYTVTYNWPLMFGTLLPMFGANGHYTLTASHAIRNEPYAPI